MKNYGGIKHFSSSAKFLFFFNWYQSKIRIFATNPERISRMAADFSCTDVGYDRGAKWHVVLGMMGNGKVCNSVLNGTLSSSGPNSCSVAGQTTSRLTKKEEEEMLLCLWFWWLNSSFSFYCSLFSLEPKCCILELFGWMFELKMSAMSHTS